MSNADVVVSIGLPVRNAGERIADVIGSVLAQDHEHVELVISDNASSDDTEEVCRDLAAADSRIAYHRQARNIGLLPNFIFTMGAARGEYFRWIGDDDELSPAYASTLLRVFAEEPRLILVSSQLEYVGPDGQTQTAAYDGGGLDSADPVERFAEMLRLLNESHLLIDPLYSLMRRSAVVDIPRRNMLREDEVFATKLALAGPWGHVPQVLARRNWKAERIGSIARRLDVPSWQSHFANTLQGREMLHWLGEVGLTAQQRADGRAAVHRWYLRRQGRMLGHRSRKLVRLALRRT